ncbi:MAG: MBL fold metallo-hydrolase [Candidatus Omnitrophota bacterium]|jgi:glyoxylase-like metal-dependent hydrolase (beta-lactamase superfamily II)
MILEALCVGPFQVNCYILAAEADSAAILIDPGADEKKIRRVLAKHRLKPAFIVNTHGHIDHIADDDKFGVPIYIHRQDAALLKNPELNLSNFLMSSQSVNSKVEILEDKQKIELGAIRMEVIHTPGHTPGGICLLLEKPENKILFTGDTLFCQGVGRTDFSYGNEKQLINSIKDKLMKLPPETVIYPGHGPSSTIGEEKKANPFLS